MSSQLEALSTAPAQSHARSVIVTNSPRSVERSSVLFFKRYRMEISLGSLPEVLPPQGYSFVHWDRTYRDHHGEVLYRSFYQQIDSVVFASLGDSTGCRQLIYDLSQRSDFIPESTWLLASPTGFCGTVQGLRSTKDQGAIQNLGITSEHQGQGLGGLLLLQALHGFRHVGMKRATLEVTAENAPAVRLYRRLGFRRIKTLYKTVALS